MAVTIGAFFFVNYSKRKFKLINRYKYMKSIVIEQLSLRGLEHIFSDKQFNSYSRKILSAYPHANRYYVALGIFDMFVLNAQ